MSQACRGCSTGAASSSPSYGSRHRLSRCWYRVRCGGRRGTMRAALGWLLRGGVLGVIAFVIFGPLANLVLWAVAIQWYFPHKLPLTYGFRYWGEVFKPTSDALASLGTSVLIAS